MLNAVIMDFNGVIIDDEPVHLMLFQKVLAEEGVTLTDQQYQQEFLGYDDRGCLSAALLAAGRQVTDQGLADLIARKSTYYNAYIRDHMTIFPGVTGFIRRAAEAHALAVCSGALRNEIEYVLGRLGVRPYFRAVVAAEDTTRWKPDPQGYLKTCEALRRAGHTPLDEGQCVVVEDSLAGIEAAHRAGMKCVAVTNSYSADQLGEAERVVSSLEGLTLEALRGLVD